MRAKELEGPDTGRMQGKMRVWGEGGVYREGRRWGGGGGVIRV